MNAQTTAGRMLRPCGRFDGQPGRACTSCQNAGHLVSKLGNQTMQPPGIACAYNYKS